MEITNSSLILRCHITIWKKIKLDTIQFFAKYKSDHFQTFREKLDSPPIPYFTWSPSKDLRWIVHSPVLKDRLANESSRFVDESLVNVADLIFFDPSFDARPSSTSHPGLSSAFDWCVRHKFSLVFRPHSFPHYMFF